MTVNLAAISLPRPHHSFAAIAEDARHFQIATLATLLCVNILWFDLGASPLQATVTIAAALGTQWLFSAAARPISDQGRFEWRSALITGLSLSLLLRANEPALWAAAAVLGIGSKFVIRSRGKHFFNPATFAIVVLLLTSSAVWVSPGQWGHSTWLVLLLVCAGGLVVQRAERADTALAFLGSFAALLLWRAWTLGDPLTIPLNQLQSGALLLFSFFMITDPRSTPDRRLARILFGMAVAGLGYWLLFRWQLRPGLFYALAAISPFTPVIDRLLPAERFAWQQLPPR